MAAVKNKKIAILIDRLNVGGVEKTAIQQVIHLNKIGIKATLVVLNKNSVIKNAHSDLTKKAGRIIYLSQRLPKIFTKFDFKFPHFAFFSFFHVLFPFIVPFYIKKNEFDYIISHGSYTSFTAITIKLIKKIPYSVYFWDPIHYILNRVYKQKINKHTLFFLSCLAKKLDKLIINNSKQIIVAATTHNSYFKSLNSTKKIIVIPPSASIGKPQKTKNGRILMVTTWKLGKNPNYIIDIVKKSPNLKIDLVGGWLDKHMLRIFKSNIKQHQLQKNINIMGEAGEKKITKLYPKYNLLLITNLEKGFGMPVFEAAAGGTTFVAPKGSGVCDFFKHQIHGFFVKEKDTNQIVKYLNLLTTNEELAIQKGLKAYQKASTYTWTNHVQKLLKNNV